MEGVQHVRIPTTIQNNEDRHDPPLDTTSTVTEGTADLEGATHSVTIYATSVSTILDAWAQIAHQQISASRRTLRRGPCVKLGLAH